MKGDGSVGYAWGGMAALLLFFVALKVADTPAKYIDSKEVSNLVVKDMPSVTVTNAVKTLPQKLKKGEVNSVLDQKTSTGVVVKVSCKKLSFGLK